MFRDEHTSSDAQYGPQCLLRKYLRATRYPWVMEDAESRVTYSSFALRQPGKEATMWWALVMQTGIMKLHHMFLSNYHFPCDGLI